MFENENQVVENESSSSTSTETEISSEQETQQPETAVSTISPAARENFRNLREKSERFERELEVARNIIKSMESSKNSAQPVEDEDIQIGDDDIAEGKHFRPLQKKIKKLEDQIKNNQRQSFEMTVEQRLRYKYPDFDKVVSKENVALLNETEPEIATTIGSSMDLESKGEAAYKIIKKLGLYQEDNYSEDRQRVQQNATKPRPVASVTPQRGDSPLSKANAFANGLTDELKAQLAKEMNEYRKAF